MDRLAGVEVFSGIQPTGPLHLGNLFGAVENWVRLQDEATCAFCLVDYHAITAGPAPEELRQRTRRLAVDLLASGVDPAKAVLFVQSDVPEHLELYWLLSCVARYGELARMTQFKDKGQERESVGMGLLNYPVLQAADILLYGARRVPVGEDQVQHLELARELLRRFNRRYEPLFAEIEPLLTPVPRILSLNDPTAKMSASKPAGAVWIGEEEEGIRHKVRRAVTDVASVGEEASPGVANLIGLLRACDEGEAAAMEAARKEGSLRYGDLKDALAAALCRRLAPVRDLQADWQGRPDDLEALLAAGAEQARALARPRLERVRASVGMPPRPRGAAHTPGGQ